MIKNKPYFIMISLVLKKNATPRAQKSPNNTFNLINLYNICSKILLYHYVYILRKINDLFRD